MLCPNCGKDVGENAGLCPSCMEMQSFFSSASVSPSSSGSQRAVVRGEESPELSIRRSGEMRPIPSASRRSPVELIFVFVLVSLMLFVALFLGLQLFNGQGLPPLWRTMKPGQRSGSLGRGDVTKMPGANEVFRNSISGIVHGQAFRPDRVLFSRARNSLIFRQGKGFLPDIAVEIIIQAGLPRAGQVIEVNPRSTANVPEVYIKWKDQRNEILQSRPFSSSTDYSLSLRITGVSSNRIVGLITFTADEREGTNFTGMFEAAYE